ncbi:hypothetical protein BHM03_00013031 [Ensete ventricosum]|uniref:Uncharacterized protein n=1 Tax=Ensete ventricosum TaxID=4639 RepID=A0A445MDS4_ENSVE|nr:hypothetical protein BHM03_00013031 [Ensete ventricosum]
MLLFPFSVVAIAFIPTSHCFTAFLAVASAITLLLPTAYCRCHLLLPLATSPFLLQRRLSRYLPCSQPQPRWALLTLTPLPPPSPALGHHSIVVANRCLAVIFLTFLPSLPTPSRISAASSFLPSYCHCH